MQVAGLFAGIGGIELGFHQAGLKTSLLCEIEPAAIRVLSDHFPGVPLVADVADVADVAGAAVIAAGFPCQDLSQAGRTAGITGERSGLVGHVLRLLDDADPDWLVLENVPFMLQLDRGAAIRFLTGELERHGLDWAYRVVDTRAFGLPQRRQRVLLVASRRHDPRDVLFADDVGPPVPEEHDGQACGFYWTEGVRGLGWAVDGVPTLKGGSTVGIPSPPAIWLPDRHTVVTPDLRDAERLQGFPTDWTAPAVDDASRRNGPRWKLVGNAVSVPVARWLGGRLLKPGVHSVDDALPLPEDGRWPRAAWGVQGRRCAPEVSAWPVRQPVPALVDFLAYEPAPLSARATRGFLRRLRMGSLNRPAAFEADLEAHLQARLLEPMAA